MAKDKKGTGGGKLGRSKVVSVRFDPKLFYLIELAARKQRRTFSSLVETATERFLEDAEIETGVRLMDRVSSLWDVDEAIRFIRLASSYPNLLNYEEENLWKIIRTCFNDPQTGKVVEAEVQKHWGLLKSASGEVTDREALDNLLQLVLSGRENRKEG